VKSDVQRYIRPGQDRKRILVSLVERLRALSGGEFAGSRVELLAFRVDRRADEGNDRPNASVIPERMI
jgi:hypothetical protein